MKRLVGALVFLVGCSSSPIEGDAHWFCTTWSQSVDCSHGNLYYSNDVECGGCHQWASCLAIPAAGEPETGTCEWRTP